MPKPKVAREKSPYDRVKDLMVKCAKDAGLLSELATRLNGLNVCESLETELVAKKDCLKAAHDKLRSLLTDLREGESPDMLIYSSVYKDLAEGRDALLKLTDFAKHSLAGLTRELKSKKEKKDKKDKAGAAEGALPA